jgi:hypothetical protein
LRIAFACHRFPRMAIRDDMATDHQATARVELGVTVT